MRVCTVSDGNCATKVRTNHDRVLTNKQAAVAIKGTEIRANLNKPKPDSKLRWTQELNLFLKLS